MPRPEQRRFVRVLPSVVRQVMGRACQHEFWRVHQRLEEAINPFNPDEVDCYEVPSALGELHREHFILIEAMQVFYWQHPDGDVEIHHVELPDRLSP